MALTIGSGVTVQGGITAGNVPIPVPQYSYRFQGTGNGTSYLAMSPGITIGTSDFTIEGWFRSTNVNQQLGLWGDGATGALQIYMDNGGSGSAANGFQVNYQGAGQISYATATLVSNTWYYFALVRSSNSESLYLNGTRATPGAYTDTNNYSGGTTAFGNNYKGSWQGYIYNWRVSNTARYSPASATITVPTAPLTTDANTLVFFDGTFLTGLDASGHQTITQGGSGTAVSLSSTVVPTL